VAATVEFGLDGQSVGKPFAGANKAVEPGPLLTFGPFPLTAGPHQLSVQTLDTPGQKPWFAVCSAELSPKRRDPDAFRAERNPVVLAQWHRDICRPRTALAHPDGRHVMMAGFAGYGLCGGGIGIFDLETKEATLLTADEHLLPGHSCITLKALPNRDLVGGTSISAPGGGHAIAKQAELFILDWAAKKIAFHFAPVPKDPNIVSIEVMPDGLVYGLSGRSTFFVFDPKARELVHSESYKAYGGVPRHALHRGPDGKLYAILGKAIVRITPGTFAHEKLADTPTRVTAGGALSNGLLCFACGSHVWTYAVPGLAAK